jgi:hypothetical protein
MLVVVQPRLPGLPIRQDGGDQPPEDPVVGTMPKVAEFVDDGISDRLSQAGHMSLFVKVYGVRKASSR